MIELKNISKVYHLKSGDVDAVKNVNLTINDGEIYGVIGYSGAGKSTLVRCINLLEVPDSGEITVNGTKLTWTDQNGKFAHLSNHDMKKVRKGIGMIFQHFNLLDRSTVFDNIAYPLKYSGLSKEQINKRVFELLNLVGLSEKANVYPSQLSGGQKQRVAIARAIANNPKVLLSDEATSALDPKTTQSILNLIREIQKKMSLTVVMITHQMEVVRDACDEVAVLNNGEVVEIGKVSDVFANPKSEVTKDFLNHLSSNASEKNNGEGIVRWSKAGGEYTLHFVGDKTGSPVISSVCKKFDIELNIRAGGIETLSDNQKVGTMIIDIDGEASEVEKALDYIKSQGVNVEITGGAR